MQIQFLLASTRCRLVVICFKFSNFAYANTVGRTQNDDRIRLLFALNLVTLLMQIQFDKLGMY